MIELRGVSVHNLRGIDLDLPYGRLIAICGVSGSGKTSLAIDTLYAEGQRRYMETLSAHSRQFLEQFEKPDAKRMEGVPAAIAVTGKAFAETSSATVGTVTGITGYLQFLYANLGTVFCPKCGKKIESATPQSVYRRLQNEHNSQKVQIGFPSPFVADSNEEFVAFWQERGFVRIFDETNGQTIPLGELTDGIYYDNTTVPEGQFPAKESLAQSSYASFFKKTSIIVDRIVVGQTEEKRCLESLELAFREGHGKICVIYSDENQRIEKLSSQLSCLTCRVSFPELLPRFFCRPDDKNDEVALTAEQRKNIRIDGKNDVDICSLSVNDALPFFETLAASTVYPTFIRQPLEQIMKRLGYLKNVGLCYLTLSRSMRTLSSGEQRRVVFASVLGSDLVDMLYVLDEPTAGLHPTELPQLVRCIQELRDTGNTVVVVEHNAEFLRTADLLVEIGPGAGENGGEIVYVGPPNDDVLSRFTPNIVTNKKPRNAGHGFVQYEQFRFSFEALTVVTGVGGVGKSTLLERILYQNLGNFCTDKQVVEISVSGSIDDVLWVDDKPIGRSARSNPATYLKIFDDIRALFAEQLDAKARGYTAGTFSFNVTGGRCEHCQGDGEITVPMQFLPDMTQTCPVCRGKRYRYEILDVLYRGKTIADVLKMTVREAFGFFRGQSKLQQKLKRLIDVGLDYLRLGQPSGTLSGGESQRLKLAAYLLQMKKRRTVFLLDEPTIGLHPTNVRQLLDCFDGLIETGHTVIVADNHPLLANAADGVIEMTKR